MLLSSEPLPRSTLISIKIIRHGANVYAGCTTVNELKRDLNQLVEFLFRGNCLPDGVFLMTGTGIIPDDEFALLSGDGIRINIDGIGTLINHAA